VVIASNAGVVGVLLAILAMGAGFERTLKRSGSEDTAIVLQTGARNEVSSTIDHATVALVSQSDLILRDDRSRAIVSAEQVLSISLPKKSTGLEASATLRGVGEPVWRLWPQMRITSGRTFASGLHELLVGQGVHEKFSGLDVGSRVTFDGQPWTVVGIFDSGDVHNSEIWGDSDVLGSVYRREGTVNSLVVRLTSGIDAFRAQLRRDPRLKVAAQTTRHYYSQQSEGMSRMIRTVGAAVGLIMASGAIFGALNATYMAIASRSREIATLRAIGFERIPVIASVLLETLMLALAGGILGSVLTWAIFDGFTASTMGSAGQIVFAFDVSPNLIWGGLKWALAIGIVGGLLPAARVVRHPIATGLREQ
jgi:putative ABC transport system permease protein